jgi:hypothetical protein
MSTYILGRKFRPYAFGLVGVSNQGKKRQGSGCRFGDSDNNLGCTEYLGVLGISESMFGIQGLRVKVWGLWAWV